MQRGRKSLEARSVANVVAMNAASPFTRRPKAPKELSKEQKVEWDAIVDRMPEDWFTPETWPVLTNLCRHIVYARDFAHELEDLRESFKDICLRLRQEHSELEPKEVRALARMQLDQRGELAKMHGEQTRMIATLSTKLRLTPQARYQPVTAGRKMFDRNQLPERMPWEDDNDD
jgi:hypothetical protein